ncbi:MAG: protein kinase domain-containing protein [Byssovorax sp.]
MRSPTEPPRSGDIIAGKYQVEKILGIGGMGMVFAAQQLTLRRRVALKVLLPAAFELPGAIERFLREAQAAVAIQSEHVARVLDVGTLDDGAPYIVMEHLSGSDLSRLLRDSGPLTVGEAIEYVLQAGEAIAEAHALGIVHRDLKPANLFLTRRADRSPLVKVLDFGLSKMKGAEGSPDVSLTATATVAGSPHYMSPEQLRSLKHLDQRTDIWALGVILYELLTGARPFSGASSSAICAAVVADQPATLKSLRPELPPALEAVVLRCLEKDPARRTPSIGALAEALAPFAPARSAQSLERIARLSLDPSAVTAPVADAGGATEMAPPIVDAGGATRNLSRPPAPQTRAPAVLAFAETSLAPTVESPDVSPSAVTGDGAGWVGTQLPMERTSRAAVAGGIGALAVAVGLIAWWSLPHGPESGSSAPSASVAAAAPTAGPSLAATPPASAPPSAFNQPSAAAPPAAPGKPSMPAPLTSTAPPSVRPGPGAPALARPLSSSVATSSPPATTTPAPTASALSQEPKPIFSKPDQHLDRAD